jgi:hypothetical protein
MKVCSLCETGDREMVSGKLVVVGEDNICGACKEGLLSMEKIYRKDFERRTEMKIETVIPWPAIKRFTWPPHAAVVISGWGAVTVEFAIGVGDTHLIAGRRSFQSWREEVVSKIVEATDKAQGASLEERITLESEIDMLRRKLDSVNRRERGAHERPLFSLPIANMRSAAMERQKEFIEVTFASEELKPKTLKGKKVVTTKHMLLISRYYEEALAALVRRINEQSRG